MKVLAVLAVLTALPVRAGDGLVALQTADPSCADQSGNRYVSCVNGTVTDNDTGLVWLRNANCFGQLTWDAAVSTVAGLADGSSPGEWRLPTLAELLAMTEDGASQGCSPVITKDNGVGCWVEEDGDCLLLGTTCSFTGLQPSDYWSYTTQVDTPTKAFILPFSSGFPGASTKGSALLYVWPVRSGQ